MNEDMPSEEEIQEVIMDLVKKGLMDYTVNDEGEFLFFLTPLGKAMGAQIFGGELGGELDDY